MAANVRTSGDICIPNLGWAPGPDDDETKGFTVGSRCGWAGKVCICRKATAGSAIWVTLPDDFDAAGSASAAQAAAEAYTDAAVAGVASGLNFKGTTDCSSNPNYPSAAKGDFYIVKVAGKIGGASGTVAGPGDWYIATAANAGGTEAAVGADWNHVSLSAVGYLVAANNLADLTNASTARSNLGLGTSATQASSAFDAAGAASAAQAAAIAASDPLGAAAAVTLTTLGGTTPTGTGAVVRANSPSLVTPALGTPASGVLTNCTGYTERAACFAATYNLKITNSVSSPNTEITFTYGNVATWFEVLLEDASNNAYKAVLSGLTMNGGATGANGLDTGSQAASTWYFLFVIFNPTTLSIASYASKSTAPSLPSGYTYSALVGAVYSNGSTHFQSFTQFNKQVWTPAQVVLGNTAPTGNNTYQSLGLSGVVPLTASSVSGIVGCGTSGTGCFFAVAGDANGTGEQINLIEYGGATAFEGMYGADSFNVPLLTPQTIYWKAVNTSQKATISVTGWTYP